MAKKLLVKSSLIGKKLTIQLFGPVNAETEPAAEKEMIEIDRNVDFDELTIDIKEVPYMSSAGLRMMLKIKKKYDSVEIINVNDAVFEVFHMTGFDELMNVDAPEGYVEDTKRDDPVTIAEKAAEKSDYTENPEIELTGINDTTEDFEYRSVIEMFEEQVKKHPNKIAVATPNEKITYAKLNEMANKVANSLIFYGIKKEDVIMILLPRGIETYAATLGILKAGAAYTIVNISYPDDRIQFIYEDADCRYMISNKATAMDRLELIADVIQKRPLYMDEMLGNTATYNPGLKNDEHDLCYLIYTSGSTGKPKGVMIEHGNLANFVYPTSKNHEANGITKRGKVLLAMAQMTFDVSVMEEYLALTSGMTLAMATEEEILNPALMRTFMLKRKVDSVCFTPAYGNTLLSIPEMRDAMKNIVVYDFGAEAFPGILYKKINDINPNAYIMNGYGPTEATISCTMKVINSPDNITIGKPNANVYAFIIDDNLNEVPKGEVGELLICGRGVGRGYRNLPEKTKDVFIKFKGMRGYRTGDRACINENDEIEFHGRKDNQVKLRGLRIELDEVEKAIAAHPKVKLSATRVFDNRILVGYYQLNEQGSAATDEIKEFAKKSLAHYMVPDVFVEVPNMPLTPNAKIDRKALERPEIKEEEITPPENETQEKIIAVLNNIFEDIPIGIHSNIMDLGLSSLDTMILSAGLEEQFNVDVQFKEIYANPTVEMLEKLIKSKALITERQLKDSYKAPSNISGLSQEVFIKDNSMIFNLPYLYTLPVDIDVNKLQNAVTKALNAHDGVWAKVEKGEDGIYLFQGKDHKDYVPAITELTEAEFEKLKVTLKRPFYKDDLLFRIEIYITEANVYLFIDFQHAITDADSCEIFLNQLIEIYDGKEIDKEHYSIFDVLDEVECAEEKGEEEKICTYYDNVFSNIEQFHSIPKDRDDEIPDVRRYNMQISISEQEIINRAKAIKVSPAVLIMGLSAICLAERSGCRELTLTNIYNGRNNSKKINTFGLLSTFYPVALKWEEHTTAGEFFEALQKQMMNAMGLIIQPFEYLAVHHPDMMEFSFSYLGEVKDTYIIDGKVMKSEALSAEGTGGIFGIYEEIFLNNGHYNCSIEYRANQYNEETMSRLMQKVSGMLAQINPETEIDDVLKKAQRYCCQCDR